MVEKKWQYIILIGLTISLYGWGFLTLNPAFPSIAAEFHATPYEISYLLSLYSLPGIFLIPLYGYLCDRYGRRIVLVPSVLLFCVSGVLSGFVTDFFTLIVLRFFQGVAASAFFLVGFTILGDLFEGDQRGYAIGFASTINMSFGIFTPYLGGYLTTISWRLTFLSFIIAIPLLLALTFSLPETNPQRNIGNIPLPNSQMSDVDTSKSEMSQESNPQTPIPKIPLILISLLGIYYFLTTFASTQLFLPYYIEEGLTQTPYFTGIVLAVRGLITTLMSYGLGWLMARTSKPVLLLISYATLAGGCAVFIPIPSYFALYTGITLTAISGGIMFAAYNAYVLDVAPKRYRGTVTSATQVCIKIGQTLGPYLGGASYIIFQNQIWAPFALGFWISVLGVLCLIPLIRFTQHTGIGLPDSQSRS